jgi:UDP-glucose 4-epimerase
MVTVVTGGNGFLGRHISAELERQGSRVVRAGRPEFDIPSDAFDRLLAEAGPDLVVHCAGPASVSASVADPGNDRKGAVDVTVSLVSSLERLQPAPRLLLVSSAAVYGQPDRLPVVETSAVAPISPYGHHRLEAERVAQESSLATATLRVFSAYGDGLRRQLLWDVAEKGLSDDVVELWGTGQETRDFVHAEDVGRAVTAVASSSSFEADVVNVGSGAETTVEEVASLLLQELGLASKLRFRGVERAGDPMRWQADVSHLRAFGWSPGVPLAEGIGRYARWVRSVAGR